MVAVVGIAFHPQVAALFCSTGALAWLVGRFIQVSALGLWLWIVPSAVLILEP